MRKNSLESIQTRVSRFLFNYRNTPHTTTGVSPSELLLGRRVRTHLSCLILDAPSAVAHKQESQKLRYDNRTKERILVEGETVSTRDFASVKPKWVLGKLGPSTGPTSYSVALEDGRTVRLHLDHIRPHNRLVGEEEKEKCSDSIPPEANTDEGYQDLDHCISPDPSPTGGVNVYPIPDEVPTLRRSERLRHAHKQWRSQTSSSTWAHLGHSSNLPTPKALLFLLD